MADGTLHSTSHVRAANAVRIVHLLRDRGAMSRAELVRASGLTKPTVMAIVKSLLEAGIAIESGTSPVANGGGGPGPLVRFNSEGKAGVAGALRLQFDVAHVTATGDVLARDRFPMLIESEGFLAQAV